MQEVVLALKDGLTNKGHTVKIITPQPKDHIGATKDGVIFVGIAKSVKTPLHTTTQASVSLSSDEIDNMLHREQFDVLHFHEPWSPIMSQQLLRRSRTINVATFHAKLPETFVSKAIEKAALPYAKSSLKYLAVLTAVSDAAAEFIKSMTNRPIEIVPNGIDLSKYTKTSKPVGSGRTILYVGRLEKRKGTKYLIDAYAQLASEDHNLRLVIAGNGPDRQKLERYVARLKIPRVEFLGYVEENKKLKLLSQADVFCSPALYGESFGIVLLEAMASGTVTVAGNNPGYASVLKGQGAVSLVDPRNISEFSDKMSALLNDQELRRRWLNWAKNYVVQFDYDKIVDQYETVYKKALARS